MIYLNFLPWRETKRHKIKVNFFIGVMVVTFIVMLWSVTYRISLKQQYQQLLIQYNQQKTILRNAQQQSAQVHLVQQQLQILNKQISLVGDIAKQNKRNLDLFQIVIRAIPSNVYLTRFQREDDEIILQGRSESSLFVSKFLHNLKETTHFSALTIKHLDRDNAIPIFSEIFEIELVEQRD